MVFSFGVASPPPPRPAVERPWLPWLERQLDGALEPWIHALLENAHLMFYGSDGDAIDKLVIKISIKTNREIDVRVFEAIELLALLGGIDERLFLRAVSEASSETSRVFGESPTTVVPVTCEMYVTHNDELPLMSWCERFVVGGIESAASAEYARIRTLLESAYAMVDAATPGNVSRVRRDALVVRTEVQHYRGDFEEGVGELAQVAEVQHARDTMETGQWKPIFRVTKVSTGDPEAMTAKSFVYLAEILRCGIQMSRLSIFDMDVEESTAYVFAQGLQLLLATTTQGEKGFVNKLGSIALPTYMNERTISAVFSALMVSPTVRLVNVNYAPGPRRFLQDNNRVPNQEQRNHLWEWVAVALFSRFASHRIENINLQVQDFDMENLASLRAALRQPGLVMESPGATNFEKVLSSEFMIRASLPSSPTGFENIVRFPPQVVLAECNEDGREWRRALLPGCGRAWIGRNSSVVRKRPELASTPPSPSVMIARMHDRSKAAALELLGLVGRNITELRLVDNSVQDPLDDWLCSAARACPRLKSLSLVSCGSIASMDLFAKIYEECVFPVESLELDKVRIIDFESIPRFLRFMGDEKLSELQTCCGSDGAYRLCSTEYR